VNIEKLEREVALLREKAALLEKCVEYERLLRDMRAGEPKELVYVPFTPLVSPGTVVSDPYHYWDTVTISFS
jgi:hypothetical protein